MRANRSVVCFLAVPALVAAGAVGCSEQTIRHDLSGSITLDGEPVKSGQIYFSADKERGNDGPKLNVGIEDGRYSTLNSGHAAPVGPARVRIEMAVDNVLYVYETATELPPSPGIKNFAVNKSETKTIRGLSAPAMGGGKGKGKRRPKKEADDDHTKQKKDADKGKASDKEGK